jgi:hypothetical protein
VPDLDRPYTFFTSYAQSVDRDLVGAFHADLEREVGIVMRGRPGPRGFIDQSGISIGAEWRPELIAGACTAKSMVALLTDDYTKSEWCAREWAIFEERIRRATPPGGRRPPCLLPVRWAELRAAPPDEVRRLQSADRSLGEAYYNGYLVHMMRLAKDDYLRTCIKLAGLVARAAEHDLPPLAPAAAADLRLAFGVAAATPPAVRPSIPPDLPGPPHEGTRVATPPRRRPRLTTADFQRLVRALGQVEPIQEPATFRRWVGRIEAVHGALGLAYSDYAQTRLANLITRCDRHPTPELFLTMADELDVLAPGDPAVPRVREIVRELISAGDG